MRGTLAVPALFAIAILSFGACGDDDSGAANPSGGAAEADLEDVVALDGVRVEVIALDNSFNPRNIRVGAGTTVVWENKGRQDHDIIPVGNDGWGVGAEGFAPGETYERTFEEPGVHRYYCSLHGDAEAGMPGAVVVEEPSSPDGEAGALGDDSHLYLEDL